MYLLAATALLLFGVLQTNQIMHGPVGVAFALSMAILGSIGILHWVYEATASKTKGIISNPIIQRQLQQFMGLPTVLKVTLLLGSLCLPVVVNAIVAS